MKLYCETCKQPLRKSLVKVSRKQPTSRYELPKGVIKIFGDGRERCTTAERRRRMTEVWHENGGTCGVCGLPVLLARAVPDHIKPRGMGGSTIDDRKPNLQPTHWACNSEKGSRRDFKKASQRGA